jgi:hypothetical protein
VYAPVLGDLTILMALDNLFDAVCKVATVFFAMTNNVLFETFMKFLNYLISLCTVTLFKTGLNFLISKRSGVFFLFFVVMYLEVPATPEVLCSVHSKITCILLPFFAILMYRF